MVYRGAQKCLLCYWSILLLATCCGKQPAALAAMLEVVAQMLLSMLRQQYVDCRCRLGEQTP